MAALVFASAAIAYAPCAAAYDGTTTPDYYPARPAPNFGKQWWEHDGGRTPGNPGYERVRREQTTRSAPEDTGRNSAPTRCDEAALDHLREAQNQATRRYAQCLNAPPARDDCAHEFDAVKEAQYDAERAQKNVARDCQ